MKPVRACPHCQSVNGLPHRSEMDCLRAVDLDIRRAVAHVRVLTKRKSTLLRARMHQRRRSVTTGRRLGR
jgi:hypothetical protein